MGQNFLPAYGQNYRLIEKFGANFQIDTATDPEDITTIGGVYAFPRRDCVNK